MSRDSYSRNYPMAPYTPLLLGPDAWCQMLRTCFVIVSCLLLVRARETRKPHSHGLHFCADGCKRPIDLTPPRFKPECSRSWWIFFPAAFLSFPSVLGTTKPQRFEENTDLETLLSILTGFCLCSRFLVFSVLKITRSPTIPKLLKRIQPRCTCTSLG